MANGGLPSLQFGSIVCKDIDASDGHGDECAPVKLPSIASRSNAHSAYMELGSSTADHPLPPPIVNDKTGRISTAARAVVDAERLPSSPISAAVSPSGSSRRWSDLFIPASVPPSRISTPKPVSIASGSTPSANSPGSQTMAVDGTSSSTSVSEELKLQPQQLFALPDFSARGLINHDNVCFLNAILQTLLHCVPLFNLMQMIAPLLTEELAARVPILYSMTRFFELFNRDRAATGPRRRGNAGPFVPEIIYDALHSMEQSARFRGSTQEDAEEFLTFLLDMLHQDFVAIRGQVRWSLPDETETEETSRMDWLEVGPKQRVSVVRTMNREESPITDLFSGRFRSVLKRPGAKDSVTFEPFHCIALDIENEKTEKLEDALRRLTLPETIEGYRISSKDTKAFAKKQLMLERLPVILIMHLKRFVYHPATGVQKLSKHLSYPATLTLGSEVLSRPADGSATYELFAVVDHHGRLAGGGHYTSHVRHWRDGKEEWLHIDDAKMAVEPVEKVLSQKTGQSAYLLFYERTDKQRKNDR